jgi:Ohr subfamily peroxiredoxin
MMNQLELSAPPALGAAFPLYTATVAVASKAAAHARSSGRAISDDGSLVLVLRSPTELGGQGGGTNPEQLFAAGLAASFHEALATAARTKGIHLPGGIDIVASVHLCGDPPDKGLFLTAELEVALPAIRLDEARSLMSEAERTCPYAKMTRTGLRAMFTLR